MRLVEEEHQLGFLRIADLGQDFEQLRQKPQQEGRIELGRLDQTISRQQAHIAASGRIGAHDVGQIKRRLAEEVLGSLGLQRQELALDGADRRRRNIAVLRADLISVVGDILQRRLEVLQVQQQQPVLVGDVEGDRQNAFLHVVQLQQAREQQRPHLRDGGADGVTLLAEQIPEDHRRRGGRQDEVHRCGAGQHLFVGRSRDGDA